MNWEPSDSACFFLKLLFPGCNTTKRSVFRFLWGHPIWGYFIRHCKRDHPFSSYAKVFRQTNISDPLIRTLTCVYQGVKIISFWEKFAYALNGWSKMKQEFIDDLSVRLMNRKVVWEKLKIENEICSGMKHISSGSS